MLCERHGHTEYIIEIVEAVLVLKRTGVLVGLDIEGMNGTFLNLETS
jgi:hypothetical protein